MEGNDSHELRVQERKAEEELSKLAETEKVVLAPVLELQKQRNTLFLQFLDDLRKLEFKYDSQYSPLYTQRSEIVKTTAEFWLKAMRNNSVIAAMIFDQDFELLKHLVDIRHISEENSDNFTIEFHFTENPIMHNTVLSKKYIMGDNDDPKKGEGTEIKWKGASLTQKIKKTKKKGKNKKVTTKVEEIPSFFLFFKTVSDEDEGDEEDDEDEMGDALEDDYETACEFRDELIPNAVYYYLGVMEQEEDSEEEPEQKPKSKKVDGSGTEKAECKPQ
jgi:nucleosome assembly protein 1-like 1